MKPRALNIFSFLALDRLIMTVNMPIRHQSDVSATRLSRKSGPVPALRSASQY